MKGSVDVSRTPRCIDLSVHLKGIYPEVENSQNPDEYN
jgi:hypothetical protein